MRYNLNSLRRYKWHQLAIIDDAKLLFGVVSDSEYYAIIAEAETRLIWARQKIARMLGTRDVFCGHANALDDTQAAA